MKYFVAVLCIAQIVLSAPSEPNGIEQASQFLESAQQKATAAVADLNTRVLETAGVKSNEQLVETLRTQGESYATQIKTFADQLNQQVATNKAQTDNIFANIAKQLSDSAATLLGNNDPSKVGQLQNTFASVLEQTNSLKSELERQGTAAQATISDTVAKLYEQTVQSAKGVAVQLDNQAKNKQ